MKACATDERTSKLDSHKPKCLVLDALQAKRAPGFSMLLSHLTGRLTPIQGIGLCEMRSALQHLAIRPPQVVNQRPGMYEDRSCTCEVIRKQVTERLVFIMSSA